VTWVVLCDLGHFWLPNGLSNGLFLLVRSPAVLHCRSPESLRDVRGFSVKFYTKEGNFDMVRRCLYRIVLLALPMGDTAEDVP